MIPQKLELSNFLSYRETQTLLFDGIHLACISGLNGAGKSSLLDAMTWALFGKSRSRSDDDLVNRIAARQGEAAEVRLQFVLEDILYRVVRQKQQGRTTVLEFQMAAGDDQWRPLSEGGVRATQAAIEHLLRMDFDTFINASFFLQGQADEFTTKTPGQRKEILAELLSVNLWDQYKAAAAERRKKEEERLVILDARLEEIGAELDEQEEREAALAAAQAELDAISQRLESQTKLLEQMRRVQTAVEQQKKQVQDLRQSLTRAEAQLARLQETMARRQKERDGYQALLDQEEEIVAAHERWQEAEASFQEWQEKADAFNRLQQERRPHELTVERARSRLQQRRSELEKQQERVAAMRREKEELVEALAEGKSRLEELAAELKALTAKEEALHQARAELQERQGQRELQQQELSRLKQEAQRVEKLRQERETVQANLREARAALDRLDEQLNALSEKQERVVVARAELDALKAEQPRLRETMDKLHDRLQKLQDETGGECPLCGQPLSDEHRREVLADVQAEGKQEADRFRANKEKIETLAAEVAALEPQLQDSGRLEREQKAQQQRQATAEARLQEIDRAIAQWEENDPARLAALEEELADKAALKETKARVDELADALEAKGELEEEQEARRRRLSEAEARLAEIDRAVSEWEEEGKGELATVTARLEEGEIAPEAQAELARLDEEIEAVGYDEDAHAAARRARDELAEAPARYQELQQAAAAVKPLEETLADLRAQLSEQEESVADLREQHQQAVVQLESLADGEGELQAIEDEVNDLREQHVAANRKVGAAQQRLAVLDDLRQQRKEEKARRAEITRLIGRLKLLEKACGRDGVQALLIEQALPEIEEDANALLERLTGGEMRVLFETQRELKSRDALAETLDIRIGDAAGERPYENFSGGEQFRVNFAIRLALSKILARRAGARLQTLVIDEGFGSQDPAGRQRLVEAINVVKDDFKRILVITHIEELKDAFPTRIEVEKRPAGSQITVV
ncbi:MAG: SMC family ATPase [Candidatus Promineifilaceae bacterium]|nr:SMC family ATPase [Candidatus Promineifilaceae bacterium]